MKGKTTASKAVDIETKFQTNLLKYIFSILKWAINYNYTYITYCIEMYKIRVLLCLTENNNIYWALNARLGN